MRCFFLASVLYLSSCARNGGLPEQYKAQDYDLDALIAFAQQTLQDLQAPSFREDVEYCGLIGFDADGELQATLPHHGARDRCRTTVFPLSWKIAAVYHTHGGYDPQKKAETPSTTDLDAVKPHGLIGFVSTPGGRFWMYEGEATLICGPGCMAADPDYLPVGTIQTSYTREELRIREKE